MFRYQKAHITETLLTSIFISGKSKISGINPKYLQIHLTISKFKFNINIYLNKRQCFPILKVVS